ncbi:hypothetical protein [Cystobacter ferrugineus]|uniref:Lipoprotein n=1 Tax=Cystobacter ferrugineus TaxID=83449 RepID=A0A1L9B6B4_9BACT|nr:hypothetical protein [Cystobacter ferrugineus]OJH37794.1 hypothetical protein BON30_26795 [Cystobacter ferrugineus]
MNRRLVGLLAAFCLISACKKEESVGGLEPIGRPRGAPVNLPPPSQAPAPAPTPAPPAPVDPSKVLLRWKLDAPTAYQLTLSAAPGSAPAPKSSAAGKKKTRATKKSRKRGAPPPPEESSAAPVAQSSTFFLLRGSTPTAGALPFSLIPEAPAGETQQGKMSERGFVLEGLSGAMRNLAVMVLELPVDPVGPGSAWLLATDLVDMNDLPAGFRQKNTQHKSEVKLTALTPLADGEQVATLEYELFESVTGNQGRPKGKRRAHSHAHENAPISVKKNARGKAAAAKAPEPLPELSAEVRVSGRGEFLVKAGRWRSWEARMTTRTNGLTLPGMPAGERVLSLKPVEPVPAELLQRQATK